MFTNLKNKRIPGRESIGEKEKMHSHERRARLEMRKLNVGWSLEAWDDVHEWKMHYRQTLMSETPGKPQFRDIFEVK